MLEYDRLHRSGELLQTSEEFCDAATAAKESSHSEEHNIFETSIKLNMIGNENLIRSVLPMFNSQASGETTRPRGGKDVSKAIQKPKDSRRKKRIAKKKRKPFPDIQRKKDEDIS